MRKRILILALIIAMVAVPGTSLIQANGSELTPEEQLGKAIFFDEDLSINMNEACAACHSPEAGWTGPIEEINAAGAVYEGSIPGRFGNRKPPSAAYATLSPILYMDKKGTWTGGNFWDGRATGEVLGNPAADQAMGPFLNPAEQASPDSACIVYRVLTSAYAGLYTDVWGAISITWPSNIEYVCATEGETVALSDEDRVKSDQAYGNIALSIAAYEASVEVNAFTSKYDYSRIGMAKMTKEEQHGFALFNGKAKCSNCHPGNGKDPLFTDFTYDNLGIPPNEDNPVYEVDPDFIDYGLGGYLQTIGYSEEIYELENGKFKVPTLRNVDLRPDEEFVKAYGHNGYFKSLEEIVHFYNTRDVEGAGWGGVPWPEPEVSDNINTGELGNLGLSAQEEAYIVAFLGALSDGYMP